MSDNCKYLATDNVFQPYAWKGLVTANVFTDNVWTDLVLHLKVSGNRKCHFGSKRTLSRNGRWFVTESVGETYLALRDPSLYTSWLQGVCNCSGHCRWAWFTEFGFCSQSLQEIPSFGFRLTGNWHWRNQGRKKYVLYLSVSCDYLKIWTIKFSILIYGELI